MIKVYYVNLSKKELLTLSEHLSSPQVFVGVRVAHVFLVFCVVLLRSEFRVVVYVTISA